MTAEAKAILFDAVRCVGCRNCVAACLELHGFPGDPLETTELSATAYTAMVEQDGFNLRTMCRHCLQPSCASVCPVGALRKQPEGPVTYDASKCMGCRYCMVACPFNVPRYEWDKPVPAMRKCDMCAERQAAGEGPMCAAVCPAGATVFGTREELLAEARQRLADDPGDYEQHVWGEHEVGGTSVLFLMPPGLVAPGFEAGMAGEPLPGLTWQVLEKIPAFAVTGGALLAAFAWIVRRRNEAFARAAAERETQGAGGGREATRD